MKLFKRKEKRPKFDTLSKIARQSVLNWEQPTNGLTPNQIEWVNTHNPSITLTEDETNDLLMKGFTAPLASTNEWAGSSADVWSTALNITGSNNGYVPPTYQHRDIMDGIDVDALWKKMYEKFRKVIVICPWCHAPQAINDGTCIHCGGVLEIPEKP